jgi:sugar phosphate isomerase/epimerase
MLRRDFLTQFAASAASSGLAGDAFASTNKKRPAPRVPNKLDRIAISTWSLRDYFRATRRSDCNLPGPLLALLDIPEMTADRYHVHHLEFCATHFASTEPAYLREIKYALVHTSSTIVNLLVDIPECGREGTFSDPNRQARRAALEAVKPWTDIAHTLGVKSVRVSPGRVDPENLAPAAESYQALAAYAQARGVRVLVENLGGFGAEHPEELVKLIKRLGPARLGALPDFANFPDEPTRQKGLKLLFPYASTVCHAKGLEFDANGTETAYDFPRAMEIARKAAYRGVYSIEFEGPGDPYAGIQKTLDELLKYL